MNNINDLREELQRRREAQPVAQARTINLRHVMLSSLTLGVIVAVAITLL